MNRSQPLGNLAENFYLKAGVIIRKTRIERGLSQQLVARASQLSQSYISELESGIAAPSLASLLAVCEALEVSLSEVAKLVENA